MFLFGLFSTHLPYIILMGLYFVGFGIYSSNAIREKFGLNDHKQAEKTITLDNSSEYPDLYSSRDFHYSDYTIIKVIAEKQSLVHSVHFKIAYSCFPEIKEKPVAEPFYSNLFSRPPPSFFI